MKVIRALCTLVVAGLLFGCAGKDQPRGSLTAPPGSGQPFEVIKFKSYDSLQSTVWRYQKRCAESRGFPVEADPTYDSGSALLQRIGNMGDTTPEAARRNGLHNGPVAPVGGPTPQRPSAATSRALEECFEEAYAKLGGESRKLGDEFASLVNDLSSSFYAAFRPVAFELLVEVNKCAVERGWKPVQPVKVEDPTASPAEIFGVQTATSVPGDGRDEYIPLPGEIDLALVLAECRRDLKIPSRLLEKAIALEQPIVDKYEGRIIELNEKLDHAARRAPEVLQ